MQINRLIFAGFIILINRYNNLKKRCVGVYLELSKILCFKNSIDKIGVLWQNYVTLWNERIHGITFRFQTLQEEI